MDPEHEQAAITDSLELCAEAGADIVPAVFAAFFAASAPARELMQYSDAHMRGRMLEATLDLFFTDECLGPGNYLEWELDNHLTAYGATPAMYESLFAGMLEVVRRGVGQRWSSDHEAAWHSRIDRIMAQVRAHRAA